MNQDVVALQNATATSNGPIKPSQDLGKEEFLKLLMTQLSAQDPGSPMDATQFTAQLSQFASLEQQSNTNSKLDNLITISGASNSANAVSLLGKEVRVENSKIKGPAKVAYELASEAADVKLEVRDKNQHVVKTIANLPGTKGLHDVTISDLEAGEYTVYAVAKDGKDQKIETRVSTVEKVKSVSFVGNIPQLSMESGVETPASSLLDIRMPNI